MLIAVAPGIEDSPAHVQAQPSKARPILRPAIDEDGGRRPVAQVDDATQRSGVACGLRFLVERAMDPGQATRRFRLDDKADRDQPRPEAWPGRREGRGSRRLQEPVLVRRQDRDGRHRTIMHAPNVRRTERGIHLVVAVLDPVTEVAPYTGPMSQESLAPPTRHVTTTRIVAVRGAALEFRADRVVGEEPLEIRAAGPGQDPVAVAITMRTPGHEDELAIGFLRTEGLIEGPEVLRTTGGDPTTMNQPDDQRTVHLSRAFDASRVAERHFVATASCGICGKASLDEVTVRSAPIPDGPVVARSVILALPDLLRAAQRAFDETGGLHAAGLFTPAGELLALREDVGRHNALDKLVGSQVLAKAMPLHDRILMVSGRVSFEIVQKAAVAGVPIVCAVSAPSDLAIEAADRLGVTLVGFLRGDGFNVYAHDERIDLRDLLAFD